MLRANWALDCDNYLEGFHIPFVHAGLAGALESVQKGVRSRLYDRGRYSPKREQGVHHFHQLLMESLAGDGIER